MKNVIISTTILSCLLISCAALKEERIVQDNVFTSTYPQIKIKVSSDYQYLDRLKQIGDRQGVETTLHGGTYFYPFVITEKNIVKKAVILRLDKTNGYFNSRGFLNRNIKQKALECGKGELNGKKFEFYTVTVVPDSEYPLTKHIEDNGLTVPKSLMKVYGRRCPQSNKYFEWIIFLESIKETGFSYNSWRYKYNQTSEHYKYLNEFAERCKESITYIE